jgi:hypothetical protein
MRSRYVHSSRMLAVIGVTLITGLLPPFDVAGTFAGTITY